MSTADELKALGNAAMGKGNHLEAIEYYGKAIALDEHNHVLYSNRSAAYASLGKWAEALADGEKTVQLKPDFAKGYGRKGLALQNLGRTEDAFTAYTDGLKVEPGNAQLKESLAALRGQMEQQQASMLGQLFGQAFQGDMAGKLRANPKTAHLLADAQFMSLLEQCRGNPALLGANIRDPRFQTALSVLLGMPAGEEEENDDHRHHDHHDHHHHDHHDHHHHHHDHDHDHDHSNCQGDHPHKPAHSSQQQPPKQEATQKKQAPAAEPAAAEKTPASPVKTEAQQRAESLKEQGNDRFKSRDFEGAEKLYREAAELDPTNLIYSTNRAAALIEMGQHETAVEVCTEAVRLGREHMVDYVQIAKALARKGNAYAKMKNYEAAIEAYKSSMAETRDRKVAEALASAETALKKQREEAYLSPELSLEAKARGNEAFKAGRFPEAIEHYSEAIKRNPKDSLLYSNRAAAYLKLLEAPLAVRDCEKALELDPRNLKAFLRKGTAEHNLKQYYKALETFQKGLEVAEGGRDADIEAAVALTVQAMNRANAVGDDAAVEAALRDPEIQSIVSDPMVQKALNDMKSDPRAASTYMRDPVMREKIMKLNQAGIIRLG